jgi:superfamily I DNA and/or RNA helicase
LVGDPRQLPATILSKASKKLDFDRSLFERLMAAGWPVKMLSVQYRMHPHIRRFPSKHFYNDELMVRSVCPSACLCRMVAFSCMRSTHVVFLIVVGVMK